ncbi:MAG: fumarylacetoacetate hydrolase family protein [Anaerolineae bacterium]|nr:fumarylacetoacetate hydrolase family protein [Anaerolineae bacterium]
MILTTFKKDGELRLGVKIPFGVIDVKAAVEGRKHTAAILPVTPDDLYKHGIDGLADLAEFTGKLLKASNTDYLLKEEELEYGPLVPNPQKIICIGQNYRKHALETGSEIPTTPVVFGKFNNALTAPNAKVPIPKSTTQADYEAELAVVMGRRCWEVSEADALKYVLGYACANDISARDIQRRTSQWMLGKSFDKFFPIGPHLVTADQIPDPQTLGIRCYLNGEKRQDSNTSDMIFSVAYLISHISQYWTLEPGDIISTGTPEGVILGMKDKVWMKPGDKVTVEVDQLGTLTNYMA